MTTSQWGKRDWDDIRRVGLLIRRFILWLFEVGQSCRPPKLQFSDQRISTRRRRGPRKISDGAKRQLCPTEPLIGFPGDFLDDFLVLCQERCRNFVT